MLIGLQKVAVFGSPNTHTQGHVFLSACMCFSIMKLPEKRYQENGRVVKNFGQDESFLQAVQKTRKHSNTHTQT